MPRNPRVSKYLWRLRDKLRKRKQQQQKPASESDDDASMVTTASEVNVPPVQKPSSEQELKQHVAEAIKSIESKAEDEDAAQKQRAAEFMKALCMPDFSDTLFPGLPCRPWKLVNLDEVYAKCETIIPLDMKSVEDQSKLVALASGALEGYNYGGFGEDRTELWKGFEPGAEKMVHLGVDFNRLPEGQMVCLPEGGKVVHVMQDDTKFNGWGGRVIVDCDDVFVLFGHLDPCRLPKLDAQLKTGDTVGYIGAGDVNGGWFPHLHLQVMDASCVRRFLKTNAWEQIDGYDFKGDLDTLGVVDPMAWMQGVKERQEKEAEEKQEAIHMELRHMLADLGEVQFNARFIIHEADKPPRMDRIADVEVYFKFNQKQPFYFSLDQETRFQIVGTSMGMMGLDFHVRPTSEDSNVSRVFVLSPTDIRNAHKEWRDKATDEWIDVAKERHTAADAAESDCKALSDAIQSFM
jgi:hypothetical protein